MKYREITSYADGSQTGTVLYRIILNDSEVIEYEGVPEDQIETWERSGIRLGSNVFKPQEDPKGFFRWLQLEDSSYCKTGPIYDEGEE